MESQFLGKYPDGIWRDTRFAALVKAAVHGGVARRIVIEGAHGAGKSLRADILAAAMVCENSSRAPCGECPSCRMAARGAHPDIRFAEKDGKKTYSVDAMRELRRDAYEKPSISRVKVYIVDDAHELSPACQNTLLKVLEEPPQSSGFIFMCNSAAAMLPTILSRTARYTCPPLSRQQLTELLIERFADTPPETIARAARLSDGLPGRAIAIASGETSDAESAADEFLRAAHDTSERRMLRSAKKLEKAGAEAGEEFLRAVRLGLCDAMRVKTVGGGADDTSVMLSQRFTFETMDRLARAVTEAERWKHQNVGQAQCISALTAAFGIVTHEKNIGGY